MVLGRLESFMLVSIFKLFKNVTFQVLQQFAMALRPFIQAIRLVVKHVYELFKMKSKLKFGNLFNKIFKKNNKFY
jgi:hypothetical protein